MLTYPSIDRVAFHVFSWPVYWYGLMYLIGFLAGWGVLSLRLGHHDRGFTKEQLADAAFFTALGGIIGGRLGYMLFYDWPTLMVNPLTLFKTWEGGMSIHGGFLGSIVALFYTARKQCKPFLALTDLITPAVPIGLGVGRIGNFINGELWGRVTNVPWGMVFPQGGPDARHPSQLYECGLEGIVLFIVLWLYSRKLRPLGAVSGLFALLYGVFRFSIEFFRQPDLQIGYLFGWMTEGQLLSIPLIIFGATLLVGAYWRKFKKENQYAAIP